MSIESDMVSISSIINNINGLYANLVNYTVGLILFVGAFIPGVISFFQRKQFNREYEDLSRRILAEIRHELSEAEEKLKSMIAEEQLKQLELLKETNKELENRLRTEICIVQGAASHLQAQQHDEYPDSCLSSCSDALFRYLEGKDERNARSIINIIKDTIEKLSASDFEESLFNPQQSVDKILETLKKHNVNGHYSHDIREIELEFKQKKSPKKQTTDQPANLKERLLNTK